MPIYTLIDAVGISIICVVVGLVVIAGGIVLGIFLYRKHFKTSVETLKKTYDDYHTQLTVDCKNMVSRLEVLGQSNDYFQAMYEERKKQYEDILRKRDKDVETSLKSLSTMEQEKDYKSFREIQGSCEKSVSDFVKSVCNFNADLTAILQDDNDIHSASVAVKEKYRKVKEFYTNHSQELKPLAHSFDLVLKRAEKDFALFDDASDRADFTTAKKILADLTKLLDAVLSVMDSLPLLEASVSAVLPQKLDALLAQYNEMLKDDYYLENLKVPENVEAMKKEVAALQDQLQYLDVRGVKEKIDEISHKITDFQAHFEEEKKAKETFLSSQSSLSDSSFEIEKRYSRMLNQLPSYQKTFVLDKKYVSQMSSLKSDIEDVSYLKRQLDQYLDTDERKPYTVITTKMSEMTNGMQKAIRTMDDYQAYLDSLKKDSSAVYQGLRTYYIKLKEGERKVRDIGVKAYSQSTEEEFGKLYTELEEIDKIVLTMPVDVTAAKSHFDSFEEEAGAFLASIENREEEAKEAEEAIVKANIYRLEYADAQPRLDSAEKAFFQADFTQARELATATANMFQTASEN